MQREYILYVSVTFTARNEIRKEKIKIKKNRFPLEILVSNFRLMIFIYLFIFIFLVEIEQVFLTS
jgi:hypothetical protein